MNLDLDVISRNMTGKTLLSESEIVAIKEPLPIRCGVYFLLQGDRIVYVGQSKNILVRIPVHLAKGKAFDAFAYVECEPSQLDALETLYIHHLKPELNGSWGFSDRVCAPIRIDDLIAEAGE